MNFKPMLAASLDGVDLATLRYPLLASPKLDGVRCIIWEGVAYSRNAKPIRNKFVQAWAKNFHNLDGELIVGSPTEGLVLNRTQSGVMSFDGEPDFSYWLFDSPNRPALSFERNFFDNTEEITDEKIAHVPHYFLHNHYELEAFEGDMLAQGYEGVMLRSPDGPYKHGRSTFKEGYLMKLKRFMDGEAKVIAVEEGMVNHNELERDELGRAKRSKHQENLVPSGMVGTLICHDPKWGELRVAPGTMTHAERKALWIHKEGLIGETIHWRSFGYGTKDKPRFPRYYGIRCDAAEPSSIY